MCAYVCKSARACVRVRKKVKGRRIDGGRRKGRGRVRGIYRSRMGRGRRERGRESSRTGSHYISLNFIGFDFFDIQGSKKTSTDMRMHFASGGRSDVIPHELFRCFSRRNTDGQRMI